MLKHSRKAKSNAALILKIDIQSLTVIKDQFFDDAALADIAEELPDSTPRFLVVSYEMKHRDGRISYPLVVQLDRAPTIECFMRVQAHTCFKKPISLARCIVGFIRYDT
ncbi:hypothetical protein BDEG_20678 [Batrachochytrium dendrobatidis JEL423]|uniref:ADF-H domain-containing protein n=1 Tax=Batrachochytrium dendrobatidis (strain JEL423) TaxID=403673 RepID=A0A177W900_BATDL|nr:hypothetical protein BDEG_20678 [Batrachochytrium dendrobatidis JEL423]